MKTRRIANNDYPGYYGGVVVVVVVVSSYSPRGIQRALLYARCGGALSIELQWFRGIPLLPRGGRNIRDATSEIDLVHRSETLSTTRGLNLREIPRFFFFLFNHLPSQIYIYFLLLKITVYEIEHYWLNEHYYSRLKKEKKKGNVLTLALEITMTLS